MSTGMYRTKQLAMTGVAFMATGAMASSSSTAAEERLLEKEVIVDVPLEVAWWAWTTPEGVSSFWPQKCNIELRVGGAYEFMIDKPADKNGRSGSQGCRILSYIPNRMLAFEWNFPPAIESLRHSGAKTQVVLSFEPLGDLTTRVRFVELGWQEGDDWAAGYDYFDKAWDWVLGEFKEKLPQASEARKAIAARQRGAKGASVSMGSNSASVLTRPERGPRCEAIIHASVEDVWRAFTTKEGVESWMVPLAEVDLRVGGTLRTNYNAQGRIGDADTITHRILSYEPNRMLSLKTVLPQSELENPAVWVTPIGPPDGEVSHSEAAAESQWCPENGDPAAALDREGADLGGVRQARPATDGVLSVAEEAVRGRGCGLRSAAPQVASTAVGGGAPHGGPGSQDAGEERSPRRADGRACGVKKSLGQF